MHWMPDYTSHSGRGAVLRLAHAGAPATPLYSLPIFSEESLVFPAVARIDAPVHKTPGRATEQASRTIELAAALCSKHDSTHDSPPTRLLMIYNSRPVSPAIPLIDAQVHKTSARATEHAAHTTEQPPTPSPDRTSSPYDTPSSQSLFSTSSLSSTQTTTNRDRPHPKFKKTRGWMKINWDILVSLVTFHFFSFIPGIFYSLYSEFSVCGSLAGL